MPKVFSSAYLWVACVVGYALFGFGAGPNLARADTETFTLGATTATDSASPASSPAFPPSMPGPYGTLTVTTTGPNSNLATVTLTANAAGGNAYLFGGHDLLALNLRSAAIASQFRATNAGMSPMTNSADLRSGGSQNMAGYGIFNFTVRDFEGFGHEVTRLTFNLTKASGTWVSAADVLGVNTAGYQVAVHVFAVGSTTNVSLDTVTAGFFHPGPPTPRLTPEFSSGVLMTLTFGGFVGFHGLRRFRRPKFVPA